VRPTPSSINDGERSPTLPKYGWNYQLPYNAEFAAILTQTSHVFTVDVDRSGLYVESYRPSNAMYFLYHSCQAVHGALF
jgi:hypothetical protein